MKSILFIASDSRSGSTLLDNMLSNHPDMESVGEIRQLTAHIRRLPVSAPWNGTCTCRKSIAECDVWQKAGALYEQRTGERFIDVQTHSGLELQTRTERFVMALISLIPIKEIQRRLHPYAYMGKPLATSGETNIGLMEAFSHVTQAATVIDSSKTPQHLYSLIVAGKGRIPINVIHIVRDGRAVLYSKYTRAKQYREFGTSFDLVPSIKNWVRTNMVIHNCKCFFDDRSFLRIRYEDLCADREKTIRRICQTFDIPFTEDMLHLSNENKHTIGGTSHRFDWNEDTDIRVDERWKAGLPLRHKMTYYLIAGAMHKWFGY